MRQKIALNELKENLTFFEKMYDVVRLVNPVNKSILDDQFLKSQNTDTACYDYWGKGKICDNCISMRAHRENRSFMKLENMSDEIYLVTAMPVETKECSVVLELLKKVTDSMMFGYGDYAENELVYNVVADLNRVAVKDHLTGCYNRRFLDERLPSDIIHAMVNRCPLSVVFVDIDSMKVINDTFGHAAGDSVLKYVSSILQSCIHVKEDWVVRYGGDEFIVGLNMTDTEQASRVKELINASFNHKPLRIKQKKLTLSVSMGSVTVEEIPYTAEEIIQIADRKMYEEKRKKKEDKPVYKNKKSK